MNGKEKNTGSLSERQYCKRNFCSRLHQTGNILRTFTPVHAKTENLLLAFAIKFFFRRTSEYLYFHPASPGIIVVPDCDVNAALHIAGRRDAVEYSLNRLSVFRLAGVCGVAYLRTIASSQRKVWQFMNAYTSTFYGYMAIFVIHGCCHTEYGRLRAVTGALRVTYNRNFRQFETI
jgi:hypothetical protein